MTMRSLRCDCGRPTQRRGRGLRSAPLPALALACALAGPAAASTTLDDYVRRPEPAYRWSVQDDSWGLFARTHVLRLVSQQWLDSGRVDHPLWTHELMFVQPRPFFCGDKARSSPVAILVISGGRNDAGGEPRSKLVSPLASVIARAYCRPVIELRQVPNQPLVFADEAQPRKEDAVVAYSLDRYLRGDAGDWPVQLAMVKATVQAMNAAQEFSRTRDDIPDIGGFVLIGASKRGWTAWLTAAVDPRVRAIVPASIDIPNLTRQFPHHFASYGDYAPALNDYKAFAIGCRMRGDRGRALLDIIDPYAYRQRLTLPKLILNSAGDEFFVSDSWRFYYEDLAGNNRLRYTVNTDHGQGDLLDRYALFVLARNWIEDVLAGREPPQLRWQRTPDNKLMVRASVKPREVRLWTAENPKGRDFRLETVGAAWTSAPLAADPDGVFRVPLQEPARGWRATLVEAVFGGSDEDEQQIYTTGVYVLPDTLPYSGPFCRQDTAHSEN